MRTEPHQRIFKKHVLVRFGKDLVAMTHVHINHSILRIRPDDRQVAGSNDVFEPQRIV